MHFTDHKGYRCLKWRNKIVLTNFYRRQNGRSSLRQTLNDKENLDKQKKKIKKKFQQKGHSTETELITQKVLNKQD